MGYKMWCQVLVTNKSKTLITVGAASHEDGKFYDYPDKDKEISIDDINKVVIKPDETKSIAGCGRDGAAVGVDARFGLFVDSTKVGDVRFSDPFSGDNSFTAESLSDDWYLKMTPAEVSKDGAIGTVAVHVAYTG